MGFTHLHSSDYSSSTTRSTNLLTSTLSATNTTAEDEPVTTTDVQSRYKEGIYLIGQNLGGQNIWQTKLMVDKIFRRTKFSDASQILSTFIHRNFYMRGSVFDIILTKFETFLGASALRPFL